MFKIGSVNKKFNKETETFRYSFHLTHKGDPIFLKSFDGADPDKVLLGSNTIVLKNHFFTTGEELYYFADGSSIGIDHTSSGVGAATTLPMKVYAIKVDENKIKLAATPALARAGTNIGLTTVGVGASHSFTSRKQNSKVILALDNIIQSPLYDKVGTATTTVSILNRVVSLHDASVFKAFDLIKIDDEIMRIQVVGYNGNANDVFVDREWMGTKISPHVNGSVVQLVKGDYNIIGDRVTFADVPFGGIKVNVGVSSLQFNLATNSFTALSDFLVSGSEVRLRSVNPPAPLVGNDNYFIIKNANNNFSLAANKGDALVGTAITFTSAGVGTHNFLFVDTSNGSSFQGRSFMRSDYTGNVVMDDVSERFTGIAKTFTVTSSGVNTTGITSDFGAILINNIFQKPEVDYDFIGGSTTGITSIRFTGNDTNTINLSDVNANKLPRKGLIVSIANSEGYGYQQRQVGTGTAVVTGFGTITVAIGFSGSGYRNPPTTYRILVDGGNPTVGSAGTFTVEGGHIKDVFMSPVGTGYTHTDVPRITFDSPVGYDDLQLISSSTGIGASVTVDVGAGLSISSFKLNNIGYGFTQGEQLRIAGIPTVTSIGSTFQNAVFTVTETRDDEFAGWVFGKVQVLDDFSDEFDGRKKVFTMTENKQPLSVEKDSGSLIDLEQNLLIFLNDIIQEPNVAYVFSGGTQIEFTEPPVEGTSLQILLYRGTDSDVAIEGALQTIKTGDSITIRKSNDQITPVTQNERIVSAITSRDTLRTNIYSQQGISNQISPLRPVVWCKQQDDLIVDGAVASKARDLYDARVKPAARIIKSISTTDNTFYTGGGSIVFSTTEEPNTSKFDIQIIDADKNNTGFGTTTFTNPVETITGVSVSGDHGVITGIGTTAQGIQFNVHIPISSPLRDNDLGGLTKTGISTGDYFLVSKSNVGSGVTALSQDRSVAISSCSDLIDTVYQVSHIEDIAPIGSASSVRVHVNVETGHGLNFTGLGSGIGNYYGDYSWAKFSSTRTTGIAFTCNTSDGLTGLSTAPTIVRTTKLSLDYT